MSRLKGNGNEKMEVKKIEVIDGMLKLALEFTMNDQKVNRTAYYKGSGEKCHMMVNVNDLNVDVNNEIEADQMAKDSQRKNRLPLDATKESCFEFVAEISDLAPDGQRSEFRECAKEYIKSLGFTL